MFIVKSISEFVHGVSYVCNENGIFTDYDLIDNDVELTRLNYKLESYFTLIMNLVLTIAYIGLMKN